MDISKLTDADLRRAKLMIDGNMTNGDKSDSGWISYDEDNGRISITEHKDIQKQPGLGHGADEFGDVIGEFDEDEILEECDRRSI